VEGWNAHKIDEALHIYGQGAPVFIGKWPAPVVGDDLHALADPIPTGKAMWLEPLLPHMTQHSLAHHKRIHCLLRPTFHDAASLVMSVLSAWCIGTS
jgi:hypothetical protein